MIAGDVRAGAGLGGTAMIGGGGALRRGRNSDASIISTPTEFPYISRMSHIGR